MLKNTLILTILAAIVIAAVLSCADAGDPTKSNVQRVYLLQSSLPAGAHSTCWGQLDSIGDPVGAGTYTFRITAGSFEDSNVLTVLNNVPHVVSPDCGSGSGSGGQIPGAFTSGVSSDTVAVGDTVLVEFSLPAASDVKLWVEW